VPATAAACRRPRLPPKGGHPHACLRGGRRGRPHQYHQCRSPASPVPPPRSSSTTTMIRYSEANSPCPAASRSGEVKGATARSSADPLARRHRHVVYVDNLPCNGHRRFSAAGIEPRRPVTSRHLVSAGAIMSGPSPVAAGASAHTRSRAPGAGRPPRLRPRPYQMYLGLPLIAGRWARSLAWSLASAAGWVLLFASCCSRSLYALTLSGGRGLGRSRSRRLHASSAGWACRSLASRRES
jgi:hypothetical protein